MSYSVRIAYNRRSIKDFFRLPFHLYRGDPNWVAPISSEVRRVLDVRRNPYFANATLKLFICYKGRNPVARTAVVINRLHEEKFGVKAAFFGFFESANDHEAVRHLFEAVERYCKSEKVEFLEGPFNPNHYSELGLQASGYDTPPSFFQTYNPEYYHALLREVGFHVSARMITAKNERVRDYVLQRYGTRTPVTESQGFRIRSLLLSDLKRELERIRYVFNDAFSANWHFLPESREEYEFSAKFLRLVSSPELIKIVEHRGEPVAVLMCVWDINPLLRRMYGKVGPLKYFHFLHGRKKIRKLIIYAVGIRKSYQRTRAFSLLLDSMCQIALNYDVLETTWMLPENVLATKAAERLGMVPDKHFFIYGKPLLDSRQQTKDLQFSDEIVTSAVGD